MSSKGRDRPIDSKNEEAPLSRRRFLASTTAGVASALVTTQAVAETLADVPPRGGGADPSGNAERSKFGHLSMLPEAGAWGGREEPKRAPNLKGPPGRRGGVCVTTNLAY